MRDLGLLLKYWNSKTFGKGTKRMLVSHAVVIMVIAYLQEEGILPRLQGLEEFSQIETYKHFYEAKHGLPESIEVIEVDVGF